MAPRSTKAKKGSEKKVAEIEVVQKDKDQNIEDLEEIMPEVEINAIKISEKKPKRGRKILESNDQNDKNENLDDLPAPKKNKKKQISDAENDKNNSDNEESLVPVNKKIKVDGNNSEEIITNVKGKKKQLNKKVSSEENMEPNAGKGKKITKQDSPVIEEKVKPSAKGKGRQPKTEKASQEMTEVLEEVKTESKTKGKKKGQTKIVKDESPDANNDVEQEMEGDSTDTVSSKPNIKESKGKKNQGKKIQHEIDEEIEEVQQEEFSDKKQSKKVQKGQGDGLEEADQPAEPKPTKGKRGQKKTETVTVDEEVVAESVSKRRRKAPEEKVALEESKKKAPLKNKATTNYVDIDFTNKSKNEKGKEWNFKIASWNVDGIRAWMTKGGLDYIKYEKPDILCLQEVKCSKEKLPDEVAELPGYHAYWLCSDKDGYAGVGIYTTKLAMNVQYGLQNEELDEDGRIITAEYEDFYLICTYVPNAGRKLVTLPKRLQWNEEFRKFVNKLDKKKPVIICGDMNVAHNEIDLTNPKSNKKNAGFTVEERSGMTDLLGDGFVDTYRHLNPDKTGSYTFWTYMMNSRSKNVGWRLDYFIVSKRLLPLVCDSVIRSEVYGSDHCPISLFLRLTSAEKPKE